MGKKYLNAKAKIKDDLYTIEEALNVIPEISTAKFDESVDLAVRLGVDPRRPEEVVRGAVNLRHGTGKKIRVLVFAKGEKEKEAEEAGADYVGAEDLADKISKGWLDFNKVVATPDLMGVVGKLGKILGPRGLMPNPKLGTVTFEVGKVVKELKTGRVEFKVDRDANLHVPFGKVSFGAAKLKDNFMGLMGSITKLKPASSKGIYIKSVAISTTMGPSVKIDPSDVRSVFK